MKLKKDGWVCKTALWSGKPVSLCRFFWRFVIGVFVFWPCNVAVLAATHLVFLPFGYRSTFHISPDERFIDVEYSSRWIERWPSIRGYRILPIYILLPVCAYAFYPLWVEPAEVVILLVISLVVVGVACAGSIWIAEQFERPQSESVRLVTEYLKAKKQKICPMIEFE